MVKAGLPTGQRAQLSLNPRTPWALKAPGSVTPKSASFSYRSSPTAPRVVTRPLAPPISQAFNFTVPPSGVTGALLCVNWFGNMHHLSTTSTNMIRTLRCVSL